MVNKAHYMEVLSRLVQMVRRVRPQFRETGSWFLLYDNARPHIAASVKMFSAKQGIPELNRPIFSRFIPTSLFLFPQIKSMLKEKI
jgi:hypothetical protein